jgi:hypothetical protein
MEGDTMHGGWKKFLRDIIRSEENTTEEKRARFTEAVEECRGALFDLAIECRFYIYHADFERAEACKEQARLIQGMVEDFYGELKKL